MNEKQKAELKAIAALNATSFGSDDWYSSVGNILYLIHMSDGAYFTIRQDDQVIGYILLELKPDGYHCARRGVAPSAKNQGLGTKLSKLGVRHARKMDVAYNTYMALDNYASMNSNIKAGLGIIKIDDDWVYMRTY